MLNTPSHFSYRVKNTNQALKQNLLPLGIEIFHSDCQQMLRAAEKESTALKRE